VKPTASTGRRRRRREKTAPGEAPLRSAPQHDIIIYSLLRDDDEDPLSRHLVASLLLIDATTITAAAAAIAAADVTTHATHGATCSSRWAARFRNTRLPFITIVRISPSVVSPSVRTTHVLSPTRHSPPGSRTRDNDGGQAVCHITRASQRPRGLHLVLGRSVDGPRRVLNRRRSSVTRPGDLHRTMVGSSRRAAGGRQVEQACSPLTSRSTGGRGGTSLLSARRTLLDVTIERRDANVRGSSVSEHRPNICVIVVTWSTRGGSTRIHHLRQRTAE